MTEQSDYGTVEWYKDMFADIIGDAGDDGTHEHQVMVGTRILEGFQLALEEWLQYHQGAANSYADLLDKFHGFALGDEDQRADEEDKLPQIPVFPGLRTFYK